MFFKKKANILKRSITRSEIEFVTNNKKKNFLETKAQDQMNHKRIL